jgi:CheY-like chemotaxis protein
MKKVLVVDDTEDIRMIIAETLNLYGFSTLSAGDGNSAIQIAEKQLPDLIICDVNMPNVDGYTTLTAIRQNVATATIPFIFLTGATDKINMRRGMELGADDYLTKPFTHKELLAAVNTRLEKQAEIRRQSEQKLDELRGNITLALPHELRTPLNGIMGLAQLMIEDYATLPPEEVLESARYIHQSAMRLHRLIENFLVYSQVELMASESMKIDINHTGDPLLSHEIIPGVAASVARRFERERDLVLEMVPFSLLLPEQNLKKIVEELADNAFKFSPPSTPVRIATMVEDATFTLRITNAGRGMSAEQISKIGPHMQFDRKVFEQQGAGLGLIITKRLVELQGGRLLIQSVPGEQTTVDVSFPVTGI